MLGYFVIPTLYAKAAQRCRRHAAPTQTGNRQHSRIVPTVDELLVNKLDEFALAHDGVGQIEAGEFVLMRTRLRNFERVENPIVKRPVNLELQRANRMRDPFDVIAQRMRPIVHRVNAPFVAGVMMRGVANTVEQRIAQPDVRRVHVDLCAQRAGAIGKLARFHSCKQIETFIDGTVAKAASFPETAILVRFLASHVIDVRLAFADEFHRILVKSIEIIRRIERRAAELLCLPSRRSTNARPP